MELLITAPRDAPDTTLENKVRAAFTERVRAEIARTLAESLADRAGLVGGDPSALGEHDREAHGHEQRMARLRQLADDGRL